MTKKTLGHYEIVAQLGKGGMGVVYRARDTKLGRDVALKVLPESFARNEDSLRRFQREARAIATLQHPNIVTVHSIEEHEGTHFITMELIEGRSLATEIPADGFALPRLLEIAIPVADAVSHAHERGITHRDLKPANIMLDVSGRPKVLDFGLAKLLAPTPEHDATIALDQSATREGVVLGTTAYMSPEQAEGKPTDTRSDVFSLGIILYEMATGVRPFIGDTAISTISSILKDHPAPVTELNQALPNHMSRIVNRCLAKDPSRRYQVALDLRNELEGLREESTHGGLTESTRASAAAAPPTGPGPAASAGSLPLGSLPPGSTPPGDPSTHPGAPPRRSSTALLITTVTAIALLSIVGIWKPWQRNASAPPRVQATSASSTNGGAPTAADTPDTRILTVVFPFENLGPAEDAYFARGITEEITSRLAVVSGMGVVSRTTATGYDRTGKTMSEIREDLGVDYVLEGSVRWASGAGGTGRVRITPQLVRTSDDTNVWAHTYDRELTDVFDVQSEIAGRVIEELGVTLLGEEHERVSERPTENVEAYEAYLLAKEYRSEDFTEQDRHRIELFERAIELDPDFVAARAYLSMHQATAYHGWDHSEERLGKVKEALRGAEAVDADHPLTRLARGYYFYYGFKDYERALVEFEAAATAMPNDADVQASIAWILRRQGQLHEAIQLLEKLTVLDPENTNLLANLAGTYGAVRDWDRQLETFERALELEPDNDNLRMETSHAAFRKTGDLAIARSYLREEPGRIPFMHTLGWFQMHVLERDWDAALAAVESFEVRNPMERLFTTAARGFALLRMGRDEEARAAIDEAIPLYERLIEGAPLDTTFRGRLAMMLAMIGRCDEAIGMGRLVAELQAKDRYVGPDAREDLARLHAMCGHADEAIEILEPLFETEYQDPITVRTIEFDFSWDPIRDDPRFVALLERYRDASS